jgi:hypothetical protein
VHVAGTIAGLAHRRAAPSVSVLPFHILPVILRLVLRSVACTAAVVAASAAPLLPSSVAAQDVYGHTPESSPYHDVESPGELSIFGGYLDAAKDPAGVAPRSAPVVGIREMLHLGGPAIFFVRLTHSLSDRAVINPTAPRALRQIGTKADGLTIADLDLGVNLTGDRSWHHLVPYFGAGPAVVSDLGAARDIGGYHFGTSFAITYGGGFRWVPGGRLSISATANSYLWEHRYPTAYHATAIDVTHVIPPTRKLTAWRNNGVFTLGVSYAILH